MRFIGVIIKSVTFLFLVKIMSNFKDDLFNMLNYTTYEQFEMDFVHFYGFVADEDGETFRKSGIEARIDLDPRQLSIRLMNPFDISNLIQQRNQDEFSLTMIRNYGIYDENSFIVIYNDEDTKYQANGPMWLKGDKVNLEVKNYLFTKLEELGALKIIGNKLLA
jgi:hypothetical protein